ncbi:hypothetical protein AGABI2DRAFT_192340, partial [Agaricus bisporus var. bisporus H97]|uniref:hypothetical protein n=1 Tax=Agaricus bisporus var. bisporus (strain H97 / ATCC MYA-4626 / FGSC 10389) TaxID=936046 RepID=UPI00029F6D89
MSCRTVAGPTLPVSLSPMQHPTCTGIRIRSVLDAQKIFYAVQQGLLRMVTRRLDADERMRLRTGCVYAWEERGPHTELTGLGIERFTEGRRWSPSRVRDEFLFYYEKYSPSPDCANPHPPRDWDPLVKQTYSVWVETDKGRRKWHLTAYFTQATVDQLGSIDDIRNVRDLDVPDGLFNSTRVTKARNKADETRSGESSKSASRYAPFPVPTHPNQPESSGQVLMYQPYPNHDVSAMPPTEDPVEPHTTAGASNFSTNNLAKLTLQDSDFHPPYRSLPPISHPRLAVDRDVLNYSSRSEPASSPSAVADTRRCPIYLPRPQLENQRTLSTPHMSTSGTLLHDNGTVPEECASTGPQWPSDNIRPTLGPSIPSVYPGNRHDHVANPASTSATQPTPYLPQADMGTVSSTQPGRSIQYLTPLHGETPREPLPSLSILQEAYSISYDFSVAMVAQAASDGAHNGLSTASISSPSSCQKSSIQDLEITGGAVCRDLDLAPLTSLARPQPYRREPVDDRALRRLGPRSR